MRVRRLRLALVLAALAGANLGGCSSRWPSAGSARGDDVADATFP
ncbi:hypothetical protein WMF37_51215 [Sorangium sp. So ce291]